MTQPTWWITTFYRFQPIEDLPSFRRELMAKAKSYGLRGLVILAHEGINSTVAAPSEENLNLFKGWLNQRLNQPLTFKDSTAQKKKVFSVFKVKIRPEVVTLGTPDLIPQNVNYRHLPPEEWHKALNEDDVVVIDTRNDFEVQMGTFRKAINPQIQKFTEFPDRIEKDLEIPKDKKVLIFCTGGIRCEKGILEMERRGYKNIYQLEGGILNYLKQRPNDDFIGECFVFDDRVAVDQNLQPSQKFALCPHCGSPGSDWVVCPRCDKQQIICPECLKKGGDHLTCSKECANHYRLRPWQKKGQRRLPRPNNWPNT